MSPRSMCTTTLPAAPRFQRGVCSPYRRASNGARTLILAAACAVLHLPAVRWSKAEDLAQQQATIFRQAAQRVSASVVRIETVGGLERVGRMLTGTAPTTGLIVTS